MGANLPPPHRCFNMRNPFARAVMLAAAALLLISVTLRHSSIDVRTTLMKSAFPTAKHSLAAHVSQQPMAEETTPLNKTAKTSPISSPTPEASSAYRITCDDDINHLRELKGTYDLQSKFEYLKRYVKISREDIHRKSLTQLSEPLMQHKRFRTVDTGNEEDVGAVMLRQQRQECPEPLTVPVSKSPFPATANLTDFMFGVSTTYKRFSDPKTSSLNEWTYWLTDQQGNSNGGKLVLFLMGATEQELRTAWTKLREAGIDCDVYWTDPEEEMAVRYLSLVPALYEHESRPSKKWLVICDDDTFYPSPNALVEKMSQYDPKKMHYIGTLSEDINNVARHGSQAFGGAGVFISVPLGARVAKNFDNCASDEKIRESNSGWGPQGDILLRKCIYENTDVRLKIVPELWQLDFNGDPSGFYESGIRPLSLHHYRGGMWHVAHPYLYTKLAHICGEDCMLQRFQTTDDFVLSTGFSVVRYPRGANDVDFDQFERTFSPLPDDKGWNLDYRLGPQRKSLLRSGRKISWDLQASTINDDGSVSQIYVRKSSDDRWKFEDGKPMSKNDGVIELVWIL